MKLAYHKCNSEEGCQGDGCECICHSMDFTLYEDPDDELVEDWDPDQCNCDYCVMRRRQGLL